MNHRPLYESMFSWTPSRDGEDRDGEDEETDVEDLVLEIRRVELELLLVKLKQKLQRHLFTPPDR